MLSIILATFNPFLQSSRCQQEFRVKLLLLLLLQRLRVGTRDGVTVTERGREQISRASSSPTIEKIRRPPSESRAASSSSPPPPNPPPRHPVHLLKTFPNASKFLKTLVAGFEVCNSQFGSYSSSNLFGQTGRSSCFFGFGQF
ncbi:uncharacterized protein DS421_13g404640 [Arachis hypogaea]|nr:uncharacterized protein DS421_13g404640 [Arachis hypogaea]